uniref:SKP1-like protein 21 n=1 Tax=Cicer arietinum TaxID=3827 RepID=A0A3Q7XSI1_CICAR|nr:SKP1-like protein 21 [Cicer arietinum]
MPKAAMIIARPEDVEVQQELKDERSIDELLSFINGQDGDTKRTTTKKNKKKKRRKKQNEKTPYQENAIELHNKESIPNHSPHQNDNFDNALDASSSTHSEIQDLTDADLDPSLMEKIDREVEDFERILNLDWRERIKMVPSNQN